MVVDNFTDGDGRADVAFQYQNNGGVGILLEQEPQPSVTCPSITSDVLVGQPFSLQCSASPRCSAMLRGR